MTISYKWLSDYLPEKLAPEEISVILTSIGLEVENLEKFESVKGSLKGLKVGEVLTCKQHPDAQKLKLTEVNAGNEKVLQIVCGAPNVAAGQKVVVAEPGSIIYPFNGESIVINNAVIRGESSEGMLCAEDEIGLSNNHSGIIVLNNNAVIGKPVADYFDTYTDWIFEIGLTPNRTDAMSHIGVAKDVCAWLSHNNLKQVKPLLPFSNAVLNKNKNVNIVIDVQNNEACRRYAGVVIKNIQVKASPVWLQNYLKAINQRVINNVVDITNFILHETGQPLHAFDLSAIIGNKIIVKTLPAGTAFTTLDGIERKLGENDLMICNEKEPMCIAGVFGGLKSGVASDTKDLFIESAWFNPVYIRKTSLLHNLRTNAATQFEKGVDISSATTVLKRTALLIAEITGGEIASDLIDIYPNIIVKKEVTLFYTYLKKLSGKDYSNNTVKHILTSLDFEVIEETDSFLQLAVPLNKYDVSLPADLVEEIVRIDGLNNIEIPASFSISPSVNDSEKEVFKERIAGILTGVGFNEIITNSITNSKYYTQEVLQTSVQMLNSLNNDLDIMKPSALETGLEAIAFNINRKTYNLSLFEFSSVYKEVAAGQYVQTEHLALWVTGNRNEKLWNQDVRLWNYFELKGIINSLLQSFNITPVFSQTDSTRQDAFSQILINNIQIGKLGQIYSSRLKLFEIEQDTYFAFLELQEIISQIEKSKISFNEISKFPSVERDLSIIIGNKISFSQVQASIDTINIAELADYKLFDVYENEKLGVDKKSLSIHFSFKPSGKTLTEKEIDDLVKKLIIKLESDLMALIRTK